MSDYRPPNDPENREPEQQHNNRETPRPEEQKEPEVQPTPQDSGYTAAPGAFAGDEEQQPKREEPSAPTPPQQQEPSAPPPPAPKAAPPQQQPPQQRPPQRQPLPPGQQPGQGQGQGQWGAPQPPPPHGQVRPQQRPPQPPAGYYQQPPPPQQQPPYGGGYWRPPQQPHGGFGPQQPGGPPPRPRNRTLPLIIGIVAFVFVLGAAMIALLVAGDTSSVGGGGNPINLFGQKVAVLEINGAIMEDEFAPANTTALINQVENWANSDSVKAMVLRINSPGGAVGATQELFHAINEFRATGKPVVTSMGDIAASGGVYAAMASDEIYANEGTLTGSIGVILNFMDYQGLEQKIGFDFRPIKSGKFKDIGSGSRDLYEDEKALLQEMVTDVFDQFFKAIYDSRKEAIRAAMAENREVEASSITDEDVREFLMQHADGRIFSGRQAADIGIVDGNKTLDEVIEHAKSLAGLPESATVVSGPPKRQPGLFGSVNALVNKVSDLPDSRFGDVSLEYRFSLK